MGFFNSGMFWFVEGILVCVAVMGFKVWMEDRGIPMPFWKWVLLGIWMVLLGFCIAFIFTSMGENEQTAAVKGGIIFGLVTIISGVGLYRLITRKSAQ